MKKYIKNIKTITCTVLLSALALTSCTKDLNVNPQDDDNLLASQLFSNENSYKQALAGVYGNLALTGTDGAGSSIVKGLDAGTSQYGRVLLYLQTLSTDQMVWSYENDPGVREIQRNIWTAQNPLITGMFGRAHVSIALANNFLRETTNEKLDERNVSADVRSKITNYRAEVRFLRALSYYHMMDLFGQANFITEATPLNSQPEAANRARLFEYIETEVKAIENDLLDPRTNEYGRVDKGAAWMLLAKIYLNAEVFIGENKYAECLSYCEKIINGGYSLATDYLHNFMADNNTNSARNEIIFPIISDGVVTQNYGPTTVMINGEVGSIEKNGASLGVGDGGWGGALRIRKQFAELFNGANFTNDTRNTIISANRDIEIADISDRNSGYIVTKYSNKTSTGENGKDQTFVDTDFPLFRLADVYLMYAEAHLRGGGGTASTAVNYVNQLRSRANNSQTITTGDLTLDFILDERARELYWEAKRRQDLIRFGKYSNGNFNWAWKGNVSGGIPISTNLNVFPIPANSLAANPNLTQNTGY
ncbi:membrane protein [Tenacibaculum holothuriorum]|uniref:Membrane protein n=1 Tax=Tenacibaculum holothuriorum TaxID=1635173 RepID=A0A1Y2PG40_9FLAO|nr:RagB/SusD family nutrient uptake outer membrane protein [Tenacibaculum holothuriorum]OSY89452.1 membrane protein [Tenacibaculum holothuriorum]